MKYLVKIYTTFSWASDQLILTVNVWQVTSHLSGQLPKLYDFSRINFSWLPSLDFTKMYLFPKKQSSDHTIDQQFYIGNSASDQVN